MNLQKVTGRPLTLVCIRCGARIDMDDRRASDYGRTVYADLEGVPFRDYYCAPCAHIRLQERERDAARGLITLEAFVEVAP